MKNECPNKRISAPIRAKVISGPHKGKIGWVETNPNKYGLVSFCDETDEHPYHYVASPKDFERI